MASWIAFILIVSGAVVNANEYCSMRTLCPRGEHLGCSFNENSWRSVPRGPIPLKRSSEIPLEERNRIVDLHNEFRRSLAKGENDTQTPPRTISNMRELQWSDQLAYLARVRVSLFQVRSGSDCADLPRYQVGMNQFTQLFSVAPNEDVAWESVTKYWHSFSRFVAYGIMSNLRAFRDLAQFSQMLWPTTYEIGCASNNYMMPGGYLRNIICFYGPVARCDDDTNPFSYGEPASNCTTGTGPSSGLCSSHATPITPSTTTTSTTTVTTTTTLSTTTPITTTTEPTTTTTPTTTTSTTTTTPTTTTPTTTTEPTTTTPTTTTEIPVECNTFPGRCTQTPSNSTTPTIVDDSTTTTHSTTPAPIIISTPSPCNSSSPPQHIPSSVDEAASEILMKVFYYICHLLSISPSAATASLVNRTSLLL